MPRIRTIKPEALQHRKIGRLSIWARWLWLGMVTQADDEGRLVADPGQLRLLAFGYDDDMTVAKVSGLLSEISTTGLIVLYEVKGVPYAAFPSWRDHQRIDRPKSSKFPPPAGLRSTTHRRSVADPSSSVRRSIDGDQGSRIKDQGSDQGEDQSPSGAAAPSVGSLPTATDGFDRFWTAYPRRTAKAAAMKAWWKLRPDVELVAKILAAVANQRGWPDWTRDEGRYIPHPATWLNGGHWENERPVPAPKILGSTKHTANNLASAQVFLASQQVAPEPQKALR